MDIQDLSERLTFWHSLRVYYWGYTIKKKFSSSRCRRDKEIFLWGLTAGGTPSKKSARRLVANKTKIISLRVTPPPPSCRCIPSKKSSRHLVAHETKRYFFEGILLGVHHQKKFLSSRCQRYKEIFLWGFYYFCKLIACGTKIIYNKSLPVNFVRMFKINTRKLWQIKINKQWVINTN